MISVHFSLPPPPPRLDPGFYQMKENTSSSEGMMINHHQEPGIAPVGFAAPKHHVQRQYTQQLACKENILEYSDGLGSFSTTSSSSSSSTFVSLRPKQQQQQQLYQYAVGAYHPHPHAQPQQQQQLEIKGDCLPDQVVRDSLVHPSNLHHPAPSGSDYRGHANFHQSHYLSSSSSFSYTGHAQSATAATTTAARQQTHFCKLKIGQLMSSDSLDSGGGVTTPLPHLQWARSADLWRTMRSKDTTKAAPEAELRLHHPEILSNMRIILLDWMMEVGVVTLCK